MATNWFVGKLGASTPPQTPVTPTPMTAPPTIPPFTPPTQQPEQEPRLPQSAKQSAYCPECRSSNYGSPAPEIKARCYDCGYPVVQSGSGLGTGISGGQASGPAQPARQISTANNFNPQTIIGRIE